MSKRIFMLAAGLTIVLQLNAQKQDSTKPVQLDEVVVTANKIAQKQSTTGKVVTVITKDQIEKSSGKTVGQLLNEQAGITINGGLNNLGSVQTVYMRGASSGRVLILMDGIPVYDPSMINNEFDLNLLSMNDIESIEISRGAQSTLYGSDAIAGVINIITVKKDVKKPLNINVTATAGSYDTYKENFQVFGKADKFTYTGRYAKVTSKGFSSAYDSTGKQNFDKDGYNGDVAGASLQYQAMPSLSLRTFVQYSHYNTDLDAGAFTDATNFWVNNESTTAGFSTHFEKNNTSLTGNYQYNQIRRNYTNPGYTDDFNGQSQLVELYSSIAISKNLTILQGGDHRFSAMNSLYAGTFGTFPFSDTTTSQSSIYSSLLFNAIKNKLNIELGGRLNVDSRYGSNYTYTFNPSYNIDSHYRVFGSLATGFKAPTLFELFDVYSGNTDLRPENSKAYELGIQQTYHDVSNRVVFFSRKIKNAIDYDNNKYKYFNITQQNVNGIEIETKARVTKEIMLTANYTYLVPDESSQSRITYKDSSYSYLLKRPAHTLNITAAYQCCKAFYISVSGKYVSKRYDIGGFDANFSPLADVRLDPYFLLSAYAEYKLKKYFKVFADAQNITNKKFFDVAGYNSIPFIFNGGITFSW